MPRSFPDMNSLQRAAADWQFRDPHDGESEAAYRAALADFVQPKDFVESQEIRTSRGWNKWDDNDTADLFKRARARGRSA